MPIFVVDGKLYKVSATTPFPGRQPSHSDWLSYNARKDAKADLRASASRKTVTGSHEPWSDREDSLLAKLLALRTPWSRIAVAMDRPVGELQRRWEFLRDGMPKQGNSSVKPAKRVSFSDPLVTGRDSAKDSGRLSEDDNALLHKIAAKWERDRWFAVSTRFNDKTGRHITPEDAESIIVGRGLDSGRV